MWSSRHRQALRVTQHSTAQHTIDQEAGIDHGLDDADGKGNLVIDHEAGIDHGLDDADRIGNLVKPIKKFRHHSWASRWGDIVKPIKELNHQSWASRCRYEPPSQVDEEAKASIMG